MDYAINLKSHPGAHYLADIIDQMYQIDFFSNEIITIKRAKIGENRVAVTITCKLPVDGSIGSLIKGNSDEFTWSYIMDANPGNIEDLMKPGATFDALAYFESMKPSNYLIRAIEGKNYANESVKSSARITIIKGLLDLIQERRKSIGSA